MEPRESPETTLMQRLAAVEKQLADLKLQPVSSPLRVVGELEPLNPVEQKVDDKNDDSKPKSRVKLVINRTDPETGEIIQDDSKVLKSTDKEEEKEKYAFVLRKKIQGKETSRQNSSSSEIDIINVDLWALLKEKLSWYPYHIYRDSPVTLWSPYESLIFEFDALMESSKVEPSSDADKRAREDLKLLLDTISGGSSGDERLDKYFKARQSYKSQKPETVQFEDLWTVFQPGTLVYGKPFQGQPQVFVIKDNWSPWPWPRTDKRTRGGPRPDTWEVDAWSYDWRDGSFSRCLFVLKFDHFDGHLPLTSLPYYPFELHPDYESERAELIERGRRFRQICEAKQGSRLFDYDGRAVIEKKGLAVSRQDNESFDDDASSYMISSHIGHNSNDAAAQAVRSSEVKSRVMVDYESFFEYGGADVRNGSLTSEDGEECMCFDCKQNAELCARYRTHFDIPRFVNQKEWEEEQYLICPPRVLGYVLKDKQWAQLQVTILSRLGRYDDEELMSRLKLADDAAIKTKKDKEESTKALLLDLVRSHTSTTVKKEAEDEEKLNVDDIIPDKGKGLIILLYGPPGVGKTSTAETIAIATGKALFSVSVADVGTQAKHVESNLARIFALATKWQAILLIDEADVFLESRGRGNKAISTEKNALVSVFLRVLEYYQGIMFLTTNQIAEFDVAIPSRIHLAIKYESLKEAQMEAIFQSFLKPLEDEGLISDYDDINEWLGEVVYKEHFDGRQIRNMVTTALGLARAEAAQGKGKRRLTKTHMKRAFKNMSTFKRDFNIQMQRYIDGQEKMIK